jgi:ATP-binding cassette subfamily B protein
VRKYWRNIGRVLPYLRPQKRLALASVLMTFLAAVVALAEPWPLAFLVDGVLGTPEVGRPKKPSPGWITTLFGHSPYRMIVAAVIAGLVLALLINGLAVLTEYVNTKLSLKMTQQFRSDLFRNALRQSVAFHDARSVGDFIARINMESSSVGTITVALPALAESFLTLAGMAYIVYRIDHVLALLALTVTPFIYYSVGHYGKRIEPHLRNTRRLEGRSIGIVLESMAMLRVIAVFNRERHEHERFVAATEKAVDARVNVTVRQMLFSLFVNVTTAVGTALVIGVGAVHVLHGRLTIGELLVVLSYIHSVYTPLQTISHSMATLQEQFIFMSMSLELLDQKPEIADEPGAIELSPVEGRVTFEDVSFSYAGRGGTLQHIDFDAAPGEAVAIVGPTGAGKTTLMSLVSRLSQPMEGRVLVDGVDVRTVTLQSLRHQISVVPQEPVVFSATVADNIRYGRLDASKDEIMQAAIAANAHDFILGLPDQYDTVLGEAGTALSGGERQRICVARAFLKNAPILILDEPTSSIDSRTEAAILDALEKLMIGRTTFMIAHRLSTLRSVNRILVLDQGRVVEEGTHHELMERAGLYRMLHEMQATQRLRHYDDDDDGLPLPGNGQLSAPMMSALPTAMLRASPNPIVLAPGDDGGVTNLHWTAIGCSAAEIRLGAADGPLFAGAHYDSGSPNEEARTTGPWVHDGMTFFLQDVSDGKSLTEEHTLAKVVVRVVDPAAAGPRVPDDDATFSRAR